jgi:hypothetical protein
MEFTAIAAVVIGGTSVAVAVASGALAGVLLLAVVANSFTLLGPTWTGWSGAISARSRLAGGSRPMARCGGGRSARSARSGA